MESKESESVYANTFKNNGSTKGYLQRFHKRTILAS